jgi:hypothetical protein
VSREESTPLMGGVVSVIMDGARETKLFSACFDEDSHIALDTVEVQIVLGE